MLKIIFINSIYIAALLCILSINNVQAEDKSKPKIKLTSTAFKEGAKIPKQYTCESDDISPQLSWSGFSARTKSFALICDDPDAPMGTWVHWVIFNIPPEVKELFEDIKQLKVFSNGMKQGNNSSKKLGYMGPCPPSGSHRYYFKIYALDIMLKAEPGIDKQRLLRLMEGHILADGQLMGTYKKDK